MSVAPKPADAPQPTAAAGRLQGALDMVRTDRIGGWAIDRRQPRRRRWRWSLP